MLVYNLLLLEDNGPLTESFKDQLANYEITSINSYQGTMLNDYPTVESGSAAIYYDKAIRMASKSHEWIQKKLTYTIVFVMHILTLY